MLRSQFSIERTACISFENTIHPTTHRSRTKEFTLTVRQRPVRKSSVALLAIGVLLIAAAAVIRFLILPSLTTLPDDLSQAQRYDGTLQALDPQAFQSGDLANLLTPEMPITADRSLTVDAVDGDTAIVTSAAVLSLPDGSKQNDVHTYAVSRVDYSPIDLTDAQRDTLVPDEKKASFEPHEGLAFSWPMNPPRDGTALYDSVTRTAQPAEFIETSSLEGRDVANYRIDASGPILSPTVMQQFAQFPAQLPTPLLAGLLQAGLVPDDSRAALGAALPSLPPTVDIGFGSSNVIAAAVDQRFGAPLSVDQRQQMYVTIPVAGQDLPVLPLSTVTLHTAPDEVTTTAGTLKSNERLLDLLGLWVPLALVLVGLAMIVIALLGLRQPNTATEARRTGQGSREDRTPSGAQS